MNMEAERQGAACARVSGRSWLLLGLAAALLLFYGNGSLLITDSVESNYALTAKEMVQSGDWLSPQIYGRYWFDKPALFYWLTALSFKLFGFTEFAARLFSALFGLAGLGLAAYGGARLYGERAGFCSGLLLLGSAEFFLISKSVITDAVLFFFSSGTLLFFYLGYSREKKRYWYLMYACAALAALTKGPIGFLLPGLVITLFLLWRRDWRVLRRMRLFSGTLLFLALALPWYAAMYRLHGSAFIDGFFGTHNFLRATVSEHPRDNVIYYYTLVNLLALFPWSGLLPLLLWERCREGRLRWQAVKGLDSRDAFLLIWVLTVFFFFQNMATKYLTYTYPLLFPACLLLGSVLARHQELLCRRTFLLTVAVGWALLLGVAFYADELRLLRAEDLLLLPAVLICCLLLGVWGHGRGLQPLCGLALASAVLYLVLVHCVAVPLSERRSGKELGLQLQRLERRESVGLYGSYPASAVFYSGRQLVKLLPQRETKDFAPRDFSWSSKNVMPFAALEQEDFAAVAVERRRLQDFLRQRPGSWRRVADGGRWLILSTAAEAPAAGGVALACGREGQSSCRAAAFRVQ